MLEITFALLATWPCDPAKLLSVSVACVSAGECKSADRYVRSVDSRCVAVEDCPWGTSDSACRGFPNTEESADCWAAASSGVSLQFAGCDYGAFRSVGDGVQHVFSLPLSLESEDSWEFSLGSAVELKDSVFIFNATIDLLNVPVDIKTIIIQPFSGFVNQAQNVTLVGFINVTIPTALPVGGAKLDIEVDLRLDTIYGAQETTVDIHCFVLEVGSVQEEITALKAFTAADITVLFSPKTRALKPLLEPPGEIVLKSKRLLPQSAFTGDILYYISDGDVREKTLVEAGLRRAVQVAAGIRGLQIVPFGLAGEKTFLYHGPDRAALFSSLGGGKLLWCNAGEFLQIAEESCAGPCSNDQVSLGSACLDSCPTGFFLFPTSKECVSECPWALGWAVGADGATCAEVDKIFVPKAGPPVQFVDDMLFGTKRTLMITATAQILVFFEETACPAGTLISAATEGPDKGACMDINPCAGPARVFRASPYDKRCLTVGDAAEHLGSYMHNTGDGDVAAQCVSGFFYHPVESVCYGREEALRWWRPDGPGFDSLAVGFSEWASTPGTAVGCSGGQNFTGDCFGTGTCPEGSIAHGPHCLASCLPGHLLALGAGGALECIPAEDCALMEETLGFCIPCARGQVLFVEEAGARCVGSLDVQTYLYEGDLEALIPDAWSVSTHPARFSSAAACTALDLNAHPDGRCAAEACVAGGAAGGEVCGCPEAEAGKFSRKAADDSWGCVERCDPGEFVTARQVCSRPDFPPLPASAGGGISCYTSAPLSASGAKAVQLDPKTRRCLCAPGAVLQEVSTGFFECRFCAGVSEAIEPEPQYTDDQGIIWDIYACVALAAQPFTYLGGLRLVRTVPDCDALAASGTGEECKCAAPLTYSQGEGCACPETFTLEGGECGCAAGGYFLADSCIGFAECAGGGKFALDSAEGSGKNLCLSADECTDRQLKPAPSGYCVQECTAGSYVDSTTHCGCPEGSWAVPVTLEPTGCGFCALGDVLGGSSVGVACLSGACNYPNPADCCAFANGLVYVVGKGCQCEAGWAPSGAVAGELCVQCEPPNVFSEVEGCKQECGLSEVGVEENGVIYCREVCVAGPGRQCLCHGSLEATVPLTDTESLVVRLPTEPVISASGATECHCAEGAEPDGTGACRCGPGLFYLGPAEASGIGECVSLGECTAHGGVARLPERLCVGGLGQCAGLVVSLDRKSCGAEQLDCPAVALESEVGLCVCPAGQAEYQGRCVSECPGRLVKMSQAGQVSCVRECSAPQESCGCATSKNLILAQNQEETAWGCRCPPDKSFWAPVLNICVSQCPPISQTTAQAFLTTEDGQPECSLSQGTGCLASSLQNPGEELFITAEGHTACRCGLIEAARGTDGKCHCNAPLLWDSVVERCISVEECTQGRLLLSTADGNRICAPQTDCGLIGLDPTRCASLTGGIPAGEECPAVTDGVCRCPEGEFLVSEPVWDCQATCDFPRPRMHDLHGREMCLEAGWKATEACQAGTCSCPGGATFDPARGQCGCDSLGEAYFYSQPQSQCVQCTPPLVKTKITAIGATDEDEYECACPPEMPIQQGAACGCPTWLLAQRGAQGPLGCLSRQECLSQSRVVRGTECISASECTGVTEGLSFSGEDCVSCAVTTSDAALNARVCACSSGQKVSSDLSVCITECAEGEAFQLINSRYQCLKTCIAETGKSCDCPANREFSLLDGRCVCAVGAYLIGADCIACDQYISTSLTGELECVSTCPLVGQVGLQAFVESRGIRRCVASQECLNQVDCKCDQGMMLVAGICACPPGKLFQAGNCHCPAGQVSHLQESCILSEKCPAGMAILTASDGTKSCVPMRQCSAISQGSAVCSQVGKPGCQASVLSEGVSFCVCQPDKMYLHEQEECVAQCAFPQAWEVTWLGSRVCRQRCTEGDCRCPNGQRFNSLERQCECDPWASSYLTADGTGCASCQEYVSAGSCVASCPEAAGGNTQAFRFVGLLRVCVSDAGLCASQDAPCLCTQGMVLEGGVCRCPTGMAPSAQPSTEKCGCQAEKVALFEQCLTHSECLLLEMVPHDAVCRQKCPSGTALSLDGLRCTTIGAAECPLTAEVQHSISVVCKCQEDAFISSALDTCQESCPPLAPRYAIQRFGIRTEVCVQSGSCPPDIVCWCAIGEVLDSTGNCVCNTQLGFEVSAEGCTCAAGSTYSETDAACVSVVLCAARQKLFDPVDQKCIAETECFALGRGISYSHQECAACATRTQVGSRWLCHCTGFVSVDRTLCLQSCGALGFVLDGPNSVCSAGSTQCEPGMAFDPTQFICKCDTSNGFYPVGNSCVGCQAGYLSEDGALCLESCPAFVQHVGFKRCCSPSEDTKECVCAPGRVFSRQAQECLCPELSDAATGACVSFTQCLTSGKSACGEQCVEAKSGSCTGLPTLTPEDFERCGSGELCPREVGCGWRGMQETCLVYEGIEECQQRCLDQCIFKEVEGFDPTDQKTTLSGFVCIHTPAAPTTVTKECTASGAIGTTTLEAVALCPAWAQCMTHQSAMETLLVAESHGRLCGLFQSYAECTAQCTGLCMQKTQTELVRMAVYSAAAPSTVSRYSNLAPAGPFMCDSSQQKDQGNKSQNLKAGAIAGIAAGAVLGAALLAGIVFYFWNKRSNARVTNASLYLKTKASPKRFIPDGIADSDRELLEAVRKAQATPIEI